MTFNNAAVERAAGISQASRRSKELHEVAARYLPGGTSRELHDGYPHPLYAHAGAGCLVVDVDGNERIDFANNATSLIHGHAHPDVTSAVVERVQRGTAFTLCSEEQIDLARSLCERVASVDMVRFTNSGSEAVLYAIKAIRSFTGRHKIAKFEGCYHGNADWAEVSLSSSPSNWGSADGPASVAYTSGLPPGVLSDVVVLRFNDMRDLESILERHSHELAGVLVDAMPARIGLLPASPGWLRHLRRVTTRLGLLLVSDEVVNFRHAHGGAQEYFDFDADLTTFGKLIGGGFPVGAVGGRADLMELFDARKGDPKVPHGGTFNANPVTMAAGFASLSLLTRGEIERINALGSRLRAGLTEFFTAAIIPAHVTGEGSLFRIHMTEQRFSDYRGWWSNVPGDPVAKKRQRQLYLGLLERGVLLHETGFGAISTPMREREVDVFIDAVKQVCEQVDLSARAGTGSLLPGRG